MRGRNVSVKDNTFLSYMHAFPRANRFSFRLEFFVPSLIGGLIIVHGVFVIMFVDSPSHLKTG